MNKYKLKKKWDEMINEEKLACIRYFPEEAKQDKNSDIRQEAYRVLGFTEDAKQDTYWEVRQEAYRKLGYTEEAKQDDDWLVRLEAYRELGFTEEAKQDGYWLVRQAAYRALGYTKEAKQDNDKDIRQEAELFFSLVEENELPITSMDELLDNIADDVMNLSIRIRNKKGVDNEEV